MSMFKFEVDCKTVEIEATNFVEAYQKIKEIYKNSQNIHIAE